MYSEIFAPVLLPAGKCKTWRIPMSQAIVLSSQFFLSELKTRRNRLQVKRGENSLGRNKTMYTVLRKNPYISPFRLGHFSILSYRSI